MDFSILQDGGEGVRLARRIAGRRGRRQSTWGFAAERVAGAHGRAACASAAQAAARAASVVVSTPSRRHIKFDSVRSTLLRYVPSEDPRSSLPTSLRRQEHDMACTKSGC